VLAITCAPQYLGDNADGIAIDWPRVPLPNERTPLDTSVALGAQVAALLDTEADVPGVTSGRAAEHRWGTAKGKLGFHGGKVEIERPRVRSKATGREMELPSWREAIGGGLLQQWAMNLMLINVSTRKFGRSVRSRTAAISRAMSPGGSRTMPRQPKPPASETAAASSARATPPMPACRIG
jgi:hypothetical protein